MERGGRFIVELLSGFGSADRSGGVDPVARAGDLLFAKPFGLVASEGLERDRVGRWLRGLFRTAPAAPRGILEECHLRDSSFKVLTVWVLFAAFLTLGD